MRNLLSQLLAAGPELAAFILTASLLGSQGVLAVPAANSVPSPNLDLSQLGRVALGGDFDSISLYSYQGQSESGFSSNNSQALWTQLPNGAFQNVDSSDASISAMCSFVLSDGTLSGVIVGGNFTSLGGVQAQSIAMFDPNTTQITPMPGLSGTVNAVYCDQHTNTVYVGGLFIGLNSRNAIAWTTNWTNLPFAGFNGPVNSIINDSMGNIVFGGDFTGLGNTTTPQESDAQAINLAGGNITAAGSTTELAFSNPAQIICKNGTTDGPYNTWLLNNNTAGWWQGSYGFGFNPTKLRLYNTMYQGRSTKTFYFENLNSGGILNLTYIDINGQNTSCTNICPLPQDNTTAQEFHFVPPVGMSEFRIFITDWYGPGGGLAGIEMFENDIFAYAVDSFNEPECDAGSQLGALSVATPNSTWTRIPNDNLTNSDYLLANLNSPSQIGPSTNVVFEPDIKQAGNYSILLYTPGCLLDNSCSSRGQVNLTGTLTAGGTPFQATIYQTNDYEKFDQIFYGYVDTTSTSFRPSITLAPVAGQSAPLTVVAQRIGFNLVSTTGGLNGLYEYSPGVTTAQKDFSVSAIDQAGASLEENAVVNGLAVSGSTIYAVGSFTGSGISNVLSVASGNATALPGGGLNADVMSLYQSNDLLYMGGNFTNTADSKSTGLNNIAVFSTSANTWTALGAGVNGMVKDIVPLTLNVTAGNLQNCISFTGTFTSVNAFSNNPSFSAGGFAVWVPNMQNWLHNIPNSTIGINGDLVTFTEIPNFSTLYAGAISSQAMDLVDAVELVGSGQPIIQSFGIKLQQGSSNVTSTPKRALETSSTGQNFSGVYDGLFYSGNNLNITVLAGSFATNTSNGSTIENLVFINNTAAQTVGGVNGIDTSSIFVALATYENTLWAGGAVTGSADGNDVNGLVVYDLAANTFVSPLPPALSGNNVVVNAIAPQPDSSDIYVGGHFDGAGSLPCPALCYYDASATQWNPPGSGFAGTVSTMFWSSSTSLMIAGNLTVDGNATTLVTYDTKTSNFTAYGGASALPGPITSISATDDSYTQFWVAGVATNNGSAYLYKGVDNTWTAVSGLGLGTIIRGVQVLSVTSNHDTSTLVENDQVVLITGNINIPNFGNASAALFNGTNYEPFVLTNRQDGTPGSLSQIFVSKPQNLTSTSSHHLALGLIVLIGLAIALGLIFLVVVAGILIERHRRRREGYVPVTSTDKGSNMTRLPPETLLANLKEKGSPPRI